MHKFIVADGDFSGLRRRVEGTICKDGPGLFSQQPVVGEGVAKMLQGYLPPLAPGVDARYVRVVKTVADNNGPQNYPCAITEVQVWSQGTNLAAGCTVMPAGNGALTDRNTDDGPAILDVTIDLSVSRWVEKVALHRSADAALHNHSTFRIYTSLDGSSWAPFGADLTFKAGALQQTVRPRPVRSFRYWRIDQASGVGSWNNAWAVGEFEMYLAPILFTPPAFGVGNVALNATVLAHSGNSGSAFGTQDAAFDGVNAGGRWDNSAIIGGQYAPPPFIEFDLGQSQAIRAIQLFTVNNLSGMRLQGCDDLAYGWETVFEVGYFTNLGVLSPAYNIQG